MNAFCYLIHAVKLGKLVLPVFSNFLRHCRAELASEFIVKEGDKY